MFSTDAHFLLALHRTHADELRAEADSDRLARSVRRPRRNRTRSAGGSALDSAASRDPALR
ncbi:hypothetical protein I0C86_15900 [Plantactinospora sp. S1510]|uniref:Uncharacterized protein n=1 Tax=Plantactinospora alkalitolerans TaxID=2789879 RepID=A0ABS0GW52_9ACTN|nr:hypothetical protein [Plantactinospora alkalitolerans]MBF9130430.1 hypothetical protein [Plantactinospora alkalitolerans]